MYVTNVMTEMDHGNGTTKRNNGYVKIVQERNVKAMEENQTQVQTPTETSTVDTQTPTQTPTQTESNSSTAELEAYKRIHDEDRAQIEKLTKELNEVKIANAQLAIRQPVGGTVKSTEEILNEMFE